jgi:hypothetical protein
MSQAKNHTTSKPLSARRRAPKSTSIEKLIREHQTASRIELQLKTKLDQLYKKHPGLEHFRPLLHIHTYATGEKVFARWTDDYDRLFPPHHLCPLSRKSFIEATEAALPEHAKKRETAGIVIAERLHFDAWDARLRAFRNLCGVTPRTAKEAALIASYMLKGLPIEAEGKIFGRVPEGGYADWKTRRDRAFDHVEKLLRAFAKAA